MKASILGTDIFSYYLKGNEGVMLEIVNYLTEYPTLNLSYISYYEILKGLKYKKALTQEENFEELITEINLINVDKFSLKISAEIYSDLRSKGKTIGVCDTLIAGIAIQNNLQLITNNTKHFKDISNLKIANWKI